MSTFEVASVASALVLFVLTFPGTMELLALTIAAVLPLRKSQPGQPRRVRSLVVVVPARNEEGGIRACIQSLQACERPDAKTEIFVVADNCTDRTAEVASSAGARVLIREDASRRGKGYALRSAFEVLAPEGHDAFLVVDGDSCVSRNFLAASVRAFESGAEALQCRYLTANPNDSLRTRLLHLALMCFNVLRPLGREHLGCSAGILGNGFGLSGQVLLNCPYDADSVVEDLEYHISLIRFGYRVRFVNAATVWGEMPSEGKSAVSQRARWEGGRFRFLWQASPGLLNDVLQGRFRSLEVLLDLLTLPLAFHGAALGLLLALPTGLGRAYALAALAITVFHVVCAARIGGAKARDLAVVAVAPAYLLWKLSILHRLFEAARPGAAWIRTTRRPLPGGNR